jgi:hypothetical protein
MQIKIKTDKTPERFIGQGQSQKRKENRGISTVCRTVRNFINMSNKGGKEQKEKGIYVNCQSDTLSARKHIQQF